MYGKTARAYARGHPFSTNCLKTHINYFIHSCCLVTSNTHTHTYTHTHTHTYTYTHTHTHIHTYVFADFVCLKAVVSTKPLQRKRE